MEEIKSSNLKSASFDGKSKVKVEFKNGGVYEYDGISPETWAGFQKTFQSSESSGKYFRAHIQKPAFTKIK